MAEIEKGWRVATSPGEAQLATEELLRSLRTCGDLADAAVLRQSLESERGTTT